jgi:hypothetical protein
MNFKHLAVFAASLIVSTISILLFTQVFEHYGDFITELLSLYSFGAMIGCSLAMVWLNGELTGQFD